MSDYGNEPTMPCDPNEICPGLTRLEWFAGMIASGYTACPECHREACEEQPKILAIRAFEFAEAMVAEAEKRRKQ